MRQFKKGQWVWWNDPAGKTTGLYQVLDPYKDRNADVAEEDIAEYDDRMILIGNGSSEATKKNRDMADIDKSTPK